MSKMGTVKDLKKRVLDHLNSGGFPDLELEDIRLWLYSTSD